VKRRGKKLGETTDPDAGEDDDEEGDEEGDEDAGEENHEKDEDEDVEVIFEDCKVLAQTPLLKHLNTFYTVFLRSVQEC
jgi:hypothetical protein